MDEQRQPSATSVPVEPTFKLYEFSSELGPDMHQFIFIHRESNKKALRLWEKNLREITYGGFLPHDKIYTQTDLDHIRTSAKDLLLAFENTNDTVSFQVVQGKIEVQPLGDLDAFNWLDQNFGEVSDLSLVAGFNVGSTQVRGLFQKNPSENGH